MLKKPCDGCPFSKGPKAVRGLREERIVEIIESESEFTCHKTVGNTGAPEGTEEEVCLGWLIFHAKTNLQHGGQLARICTLIYEKLLCDLQDREHWNDIVSDLDEAISNQEFPR